MTNQNNKYTNKGIPNKGIPNNWSNINHIKLKTIRFYRDQRSGIPEILLAVKTEIRFNTNRINGVNEVKNLLRILLNNQQCPPQIPDNMYLIKLQIPDNMYLIQMQIPDNMYLIQMQIPDNMYLNKYIRTW